jgi:hypothetical protein
LHPKAAELADAGLADWAAALPDDEGLVDMAAGKPVRWVEGEGWRFPLIAVVPVTGTPGAGALSPELAPGASGLTKPSYVLIDHLRSIDKRRIPGRVFGRVAAPSRACAP